MEDYSKITQVIYDDFPEFRNKPIRANDYGWDNLILIVDERVVFRIPRYELIRRQLQVELQFLPQIAAVSPLPVPLYKYFSKEPGLYAGYDLIPGLPFETFVFDTCSKEQRCVIAKLLGGFLSELHTLQLETSELSIGPIHHQNKQIWLDLQAEVFRMAATVLEPVHKQKIKEIFNYILFEIDFDGLSKTLIHGDMSADHIIFDLLTKNISGIIDFGDLMIGDPAYDFTGILLEYGREFLDAVLENYEATLDDGFLERVEKFYIPKIPLHQLLYGLAEEDEDIVYLALAKIEKQVL